MQPVPPLGVYASVQTCALHDLVSASGQKRSLRLLDQTR